MPLKAVIDTLDSVPEGLREHYTAGEGGKFFLSAEGVEDLPSVEGLRKKRDQLLTQELKLKEELKKFDGIDPDEARTAAERARKAEESKLGKEEAVEAERKRMQTAFDKEREKLTEDVATRDTFIRGLLVDNALTDALTTANVLPEYHEAVKALFEKQQPHVVQQDGTYRAIFKTDVGDVGVAEQVEKWAKSDAASAFIAASGRSGSGAAGWRSNGATGGNPWAREHFNLTEQGNVYRANPARAKQLAAAEGIELP